MNENYICCADINLFLFHTQYNYDWNFKHAYAYENMYSLSGTFFTLKIHFLTNILRTILIPLCKTIDLLTDHFHCVTIGILVTY